MNIIRINNKKSNYFYVKNIIGKISFIAMLCIIFQLSGCGFNAGKSKNRIQTIFRAMDQYYGLNMSFSAATFEKLESLKLLTNFSPTNTGGGKTELIINKEGTGYIINEPQIGKNVADTLVEIFKNNAKTGTDGKPMVYNSDGNFSISIGT